MPCRNPCRNIGLACVSASGHIPQGMNVSGCRSGQRTNLYGRRRRAAGRATERNKCSKSKRKHSPGHGHGSSGWPGQAAPLCRICTWVFWFDMAKAFGKCNLQRSTRSSDHFAHTYVYIGIYICPGNWSTLVGLGRIKSHSTSKLNGIGITCHRSHTASESRSD